MYEVEKWLVKNSDLFRQEGFVLNESWLRTVVHRGDTGDVAEENTCSFTHEKLEILSDSWTEDENFLRGPTGNTNTFLQAADFREFNQVLCVAPAENSVPIRIFQDLHSEILSFPSFLWAEACSKL